MATTYLTGGAGRLAVHELAGDPDNPNVLLIAHATGFHGRCYRALAEQLGDQVRSVALDFRAHGDSDAPPIDSFGWAGMAEDVALVRSWLTDTGAQSVHGFGHSMGGAALIEAQRLTPSSFASVLVFEPIVPPRGILNGQDSPIVRGALGRSRSFPSHAAALSRYAGGSPLRLFRADVLYDYVVHGFAPQEDGTVALKCTPEHEAETFRNAAQDIALDDMVELVGEVVIAKSGDGQLPAQLADPLVETIPNGTLLEFPRLTHFGPLQDPIIVADALRELF